MVVIQPAPLAQKKAMWQFVRRILLSGLLTDARKRPRSRSCSSLLLQDVANVVYIISGRRKSELEKWLGAVPRSVQTRGCSTCATQPSTFLHLGGSPFVLAFPLTWVEEH